MSTHQKQQRRQRAEARQAHGEAKGCRLRQSRSPGNNKQPTVNSFRLWSDRLSVALARSCIKGSKNEGKNKRFDFGKHKQINKQMRILSWVKYNSVQATTKKKHSGELYFSDCSIRYKTNRTRLFFPPHSVT